MENSGVDKSRRRFLVAATSVVGAAGAGAAVIPYLSSWNPSERAKSAGAPVEVNLSKVEEGQLVRVIWRKKPVWVVNRSQEMIDNLPKNNSLLVDPESVVEQQPAYAQNATRAIQEKYLVLIGICTHLGCSPTFRPEMGPADLGADWRGGWYCPCHGSKFDLAGRVYKNVPAPTNLEVPVYSFKDENTLLVGIDENGEAA
ncbi:MAG: Ubiquinol-cytochrome C reductase iron-sulfur subunit (EC [uncultured Thiotrichaceae bacterium]|uniref:Ubiquinol-cytochrome c reductase iron-sulfur subunit n=1 Tax=uncultured Thiotrichaceae bacterium TaxID=298394 RepID=A0A6S6SAK2_9GAMM|nr:MAG: Ubiquinol-cytochrome C reductase iron-sulfur subunit (EC [uncultured Thiotrichaceae bacterium]